MFYRIIVTRSRIREINSRKRVPHVSGKTSCDMMLTLVSLISNDNDVAAFRQTDWGEGGSGVFCDQTARATDNPPACQPSCGQVPFEISSDGAVESPGEEPDLGPLVGLCMFDLSGVRGRFCKPPGPREGISY